MGGEKCLHFHLRDSRHSINARPDAIKNPGTLIHIGKVKPLMVTSQPKNNLRRCIRAISENTKIAMLVNGFMIRSSLPRRQQILPIYYRLYSTLLKSISQMRITKLSIKSWEQVIRYSLRLVVDAIS